MAFRPFEVTTAHLLYTVLGGFIVLFGMFSLLIREKLYMGEAPLAFVFGIIIGPYGADLINPREWGGEDSVNKITLEVTRVILAVGVFAIGVELPKAYMRKHWKSLFYLIGPVMTWGWLVSAGLIYALIPGLSFLASLAIAACLTPTDPILAAAVVGGKYADKHVPAHLRHLLAAESGCNDGAAFPFLYLAIYLVTESSDKHAIQDWFLITWFYEVILGIVFGSVLGIAFRHLMKFCEHKDLIDRQSYVAQYVSLALLAIGSVTLLGSDDLLAAFSCGTAFAWDGFFNRQTEQVVFSSVIDLLFNIAAFIFIGAWMPFNTFSDAALTLSVWRLIVIAILILLLRRLPIVLALYKLIPDIKTFREAIFSGHFGPIGVGAVFISTLAVEALPGNADTPSDDPVDMLKATIQPVVAFMVLCSITIHGLSIPFFSLGRRVHSVSRTWSRHQSMDPTPEWAAGVRRVHRPEDIVINRDSVLERGEFRPAIDEKQSSSDREQSVEEESSGKSAAPSMDTSSMLLRKPEPESAEEATVARSAGAGDPEALTEGRPDSPPDGANTTATAAWKEGKDIVLERRPAPGEEVEVEVVRGAAAQEDNESEGREILRTIRGPPGEVEQTMKSLNEKIKGKARIHRKEIEETSKKAEEAVVAAGEEVVEDVAKRIAGSEHSLGLSRRDTEGNGEDDDEGWASDRSGPSSSHHLSQTGRHTRRSKSPKHKGGVMQAIASRRHHLSMRRGLLAGRPKSNHYDHHQQQQQQQRSPSVTDVDEEDEEERGRAMELSGLSSSSAQDSPIVAHRRLESLRGESRPNSRPGSRSESPARSVRFVAAGSRDPNDSPTSPLSPRQVVFELPNDPRRGSE